jgi:serine protease AprX
MSASPPPGGFAVANLVYSLPAIPMIKDSDSYRASVPSPWRRIFCSLFLVAAAVALIAAVASSRGVGQRVEIRSASQRVEDNALHPGKIAPWVMEHTANGQQAEFFVLLADQADLSPAANLPTKTEKGRFVYQALLEKAQSTQEPILQWLRDRHIENQSFYIVNAILVKGDRQLAETLAARPDVARIESNPVIHNDLPQPGPVEYSPLQPGAPATIEPGIQYTHAPDVWALGFHGETIVVASADTGVRWTHNALKPHYRGWDGTNANHNFNWHDSIHNSVGNPCGNDSQQPCDDFFHGSHTTGTAIGDDGAGNQIGMAPGAKWIACRNMDQGNGTPARYIECMEFFLAPYPLNCTPNEGDPTKAPDITINSWGCPVSEGCVTGLELQAAVEAQEAAGIQMVVAAGNSGPSCSTVSDPPSFYAASYTAGALNTGTDTIADFSSRGPVTRDGSNRTKPDITAPGTNTRSCDNTADNAYTFASGTSMATPHIAGAMALLWSAIPSLQRQIQASRDALDNAAVFISDTTCGPAGPPNNVYGWGRIQIAAAVGNPPPTPPPTPTPPATATPCAPGSPTPTPTTTPPPPTPTATATATIPPSPTPTPTPTATATATAPPRVTPRPRPTPHPRP